MVNEFAEGQIWIHPSSESEQCSSGWRVAGAKAEAAWGIGSGNVMEEQGSSGQDCGGSRIVLTRHLILNGTENCPVSNCLSGQPI